MDGRRYLEKLISDRLGAGRGQPEAGRRAAFDRSELRGVAIGLVAAGALTQEDAEAILADLDATLRRSGLLQVVHAEGSSRTQVAMPVGTERPEWRQAIENPPAPVLRHVVSLAGRTLAIGDLTAQLVSLEVWSTLVVLTFAHGYRDHRLLRDRFRPDIRWRGWDDAGTQYRAGGGSGSGSNGLLVDRRQFEPGPPAQARVLTLAVEAPAGRATVEVPLR
ncbi:hypothetical protein [Amycolatopsis sp. lyj-23]|uniref:hypothetical protein n=1 Tax=Amycolatopsis sp. lyj-23 TaxID=2789283 RepID=UPI00397BB383